MKHVVLYSGGPDSLITLAKVRKVYGDPAVVPVYCNLGHRYLASEQEAIAYTEPKTVMLDELQGLGKSEEADAFIPGRNAHLCLLAAKLLDGGRGTVWLTVQKDETSLNDRSPVFLGLMSTLLSVLYPGASVATPWADSDKTEMVKWYLDAGHSVERLLNTWSCYHGRYPIQCGNCSACVRRFIAFSLNGLEEHSYEQDPRESPVGKDYVDRARRGAYSPERNTRILSALGDRSS